jgi:ferritin-like metal-binding protein YciE
MAKVSSFEDLFIHELKDLYSAENQLVKALPKMAKAAGAPELVKAFKSHLEETKNQVKRLEKIATELGVSLKGHKCGAMEGLIEEGSELIKMRMDENLLDAALIGAAQRVEHYEIAGYGVARTFAKLLGHDKVAKLLDETLQEEGDADKKLTKIAISSINVEALQEV